MHLMWVCCMWFDMFCVCGEKSRSFGARPLKQSEKPFGQSGRRSAGVRLYQRLLIRQEAGGGGGNGNMPVK